MLTLSHLVHNLLAISNRLFKKHSQWNAPCQKECRLPSCECNWLFLPTPLVRHLNSTSSGLYLCSTNVWASWFWERPGILDKNGRCSSCIPQLLISLCITCTNGLWQRSSHLHFECCFHTQAHGAVAAMITNYVSNQVTTVDQQVEQPVKKHLHIFPLGHESSIWIWIAQKCKDRTIAIYTPSKI